MTDETDPGLIEKETATASEATAAVAPKEMATTTQTTTTEIQTTGKAKNDDTMLAGASGRFWIALVFSLGFVATVILSMYGKASDATVFASFGATAGMVVGTYMGQNKPKSGP